MANHGCTGLNVPGFFIRHFRAAQFLSGRINEAWLTRKTRQWYQDIYSEKNSFYLFRTFSLIEQMQSQAQKAGIRFVLVVYPLMEDMRRYPFARVHALIQKICEMKKIHCIDLLPAFEKNAGAKITVHPTDFHPNKLAHVLAAEETAKGLKTLFR